MVSSLQSMRPTPAPSAFGAASATALADATATHHLRRSVPVVTDTATAETARQAALDEPDGGWVYVVNEAGHLVGLLPITALLALPDGEPICRHVDPPPRTVTADTDQEQVALIAVRHGLASVPVVDDQQRFLGIVPAATLLRVLHCEHVEDMDRLTGVLRDKEHLVHALEEPPLSRVRARLPWLLVGLVGSGAATWLVAAFEESLRRSVAVAFFMPGIVYLADAIGTQTEAVAVRSLSFQEPRVATMFLGELRTGAFLGLALAAPAFPAVLWALGDLRLAAAVASAIVVAGVTATVVGFAFPLLLARCNRDPALGSGPLATVVQDLLSLVAYLGAVRMLHPD